MWKDIAIGLIVGMTHGIFFRPFFVSITDYFLLLMLKITKKGNLSIFLANMMTLIPACLYFMSILLFKPIISVWDNFLMIWILGFCLGAFASIFFFRKGKNMKIIDRID